MISTAFHALYWALSLASLLAQPLRSILKQQFPAEDDAQSILEFSISCYNVWFCLSIIEVRTRALYQPTSEPPQGWNLRPGRNSWKQVLGNFGQEILFQRHWVFEAGTALMCLIVGDLALWAGGVDEEGVRMNIVRVLATYIYLGTIEPLWNRRPISNMMLFSRAAPQRAARNALFSICSIYAVGVAVKLAVFAWTREWLNVREFWFGISAKPHQIFVLLWILAPLADLGETMYYKLLEKYSRAEYFGLRMRVCGRAWYSLVVERMWVLVWSLTIFCGVKVYELMSELLENVGVSLWNNV